MGRAISKRTKKRIVKEINQLLADGVPVSKITKELGISKSFVYNHGQFTDKKTDVKDELFPDPFEKFEAIQRDYEAGIMEFIKVMVTSNYGKLIEENDQQRDTIDTLRKENEELRLVAETAKHSNITDNLRRHFGLAIPKWD